MNEEEIRENMNKVCVGPTADLVAQWTFNEGSGEQLVDTSGNKTHGSFERCAVHFGGIRGGCDGIGEVC